MIELEILEVKAVLSHWEPILKEWIKLNKKVYVETKGKNTPYSYKERTNIGFLAGASIKAGWLALEECGTQKTVQETSSAGRADLLLWKEKLHNSVESKLTTDSPEKLIKKIAIRHGSAMSDAKKMQQKEDIKRVAVTFIIPRFLSNTNLNDVKAGLAAVIEKCKEQKPDFIAAVFPGPSARKARDGNAQDMYAYGIIVIGSCV